MMSTSPRRTGLRLATSSAIALSSALATAAVILPAPAYGQALPVLSGAPGADGGATVTTAANSMGVNLNDANRIISWDTFDVNAGRSVNFTTTDGATPFSVLNRVVTNAQSDINGSITAQSNIAVWLVNQTGIFFGPNGSFSGGRLVLSTLDLDASFSDASFLAGVATGQRFSGASTSAITLQSGSGDIATAGSFVAIGQDITVAKTVTATGGDVAFIAARDVSFPVGLGSPLSITINQGTTLATAKVDSSGAITGNNVRLVGASQAGAIANLLNVSGGSLTATATDGAVVLATNSVAAKNVTVTTPGGDGIVTAGALNPGAGKDLIINAHGALAAGGALTARDLSITAASGVPVTGITAAQDLSLTQTGGGLTFDRNALVGTPSWGRDISLTAAGTVDVSSLLPFTSPGAINITSTTGNIVSNNAAVASLSAGTDINLSAAAGMVTFSSLVTGATGQNISITAQDFSLPNINASLDLSITDTLAGFTFSPASFAWGRDINLTATNGGGVTVTGNLLSPGAARITAAGDIQAASIATTNGAIALTANGNVLGNPGTMTLNAGGANGDVSVIANQANLAEVTASNSIGIRAGGNLSGTDFNAGEDIAIDGGGSVNVSTLTADDDINVQAAGLVTLDTVLTDGSGPDTRTVNVTATPITFTNSAANGANISLASTGNNLVLTTSAANTGAASGGIALGAAGTIDARALTSVQGITLNGNVQTAGPVVYQAVAGEIVGDSITSTGGGISLTAGANVRGNTVPGMTLSATTAGSDITATATAGSANVLSAIADRTVHITTGTSTTIGSASSSTGNIFVAAGTSAALGNLTATGGSIGARAAGVTTGGTLNAGEDIAVTVTGAGNTVNLTTLNAGDDIDVNAAGAVTVGTAFASAAGPDTRRVNLGVTPIDFITPEPTDHEGSSIRLTSTGGALGVTSATMANVAQGRDIILQGTAVNAPTLDARRDIAITGPVSTAGALGYTARTGSIKADSVSTTNGAISLQAATDITGNTVAKMNVAAGGATSDAGIVATGGQAQLGTVTAGRALVISTGAALDITSANAVGIAAIVGTTAALGDLTAATSIGVRSVGSMTGGTLDAGVDLALAVTGAGSTVNVTNLRAGDDIDVTATGGITVTQALARGTGADTTSIDLTTTPLTSNPFETADHVNSDIRLKSTTGGVTLNGSAVTQGANAGDIVIDGQTGISGAGATVTGARSVALISRGASDMTLGTVSASEDLGFQAGGAATFTSATAGDDLTGLVGTTLRIDTGNTTSTGGALVDARAIDFTTPNVTFTAGDALLPGTSIRTQSTNLQVGSLTSALGNIAVTATGGGSVSGIAGAPSSGGPLAGFGRADLAASGVDGTITVITGAAGTAQLGTVTAGTGAGNAAGNQLTVTAGTIDLRTGTVRDGRTALTSVTGDIGVAGSLTGRGNVTLNSAANLRIADHVAGVTGFVSSTAGNVDIDAARSVIGYVGSNTMTTATGIDALASDGAITITGTGDLRIDTITAAGNVGITIDGSLTGTAPVGGERGAGLTGGAVFANGTADIDAGNTAPDLVRLNRVEAGGNVIIDATNIAIGTLRTPGVSTLTGGTSYIGVRSSPGNLTLAFNGPLANANTSSLTSDDFIETGFGKAAIASNGGAVNLTIGDNAQLSSVTAANNVTISADGLTATGAITANNAGAISLTAIEGTLQIAGGSAGATAQVIKQGGLLANAGDELRITGTLTAAGNATITSNTHALIDQVNSTGGDLSVTSTTGETRLAAGSAAGNATVLANTNARVGSLTSTGGNLSVTATAGDVSGAALAAPATDGRLLTGFDRADLTASALNQTILATATGIAQLGTLNAGTGLTLAVGAQITATGASVDLASATAANGGLTVTASGGNAIVASGTSGSTADVTASANVRLGSLTSRQLDARATATNGDVTGLALVPGVAPASSLTAPLNTGFGAANLSAGGAGGVFVTANNGVAQVGALAGAMSINATAQALSVDTATTTAANMNLTATAGSLVLGTGTIGGSATLTKTGATGEVDVTSLSTGNFNGSTGSATITSSTNIRTGSITARGGNISLAAANGEVTGRGVGGRAALTAALGKNGAGVDVVGSDRSVLVTAGRLARLGAVQAGDDAIIRAGDAGVGSIDATTVNTARGDADLRVFNNVAASANGMSFTSVTGGRNVLLDTTGSNGGSIVGPQVTATTGSIAARAQGAITATTGYSANADIGVTAGQALSIATTSAGDDISLGGASVTLGSVTARGDGPGNTDVDLTLMPAPFVAGAADNANIAIASTAGAVDVTGDLSAQRNISVTSVGGATTLAGNVTAGVAPISGDLTVNSGGALTLGVLADPRMIQATGAVSLTAAGDIGQRSGALTIQSGTGPLTVTATTPASIALGDTAFIGGSVANRESVVNLNATGGTVTFGAVDAQGLTVRAGGQVTGTAAITAGNATRPADGAPTTIDIQTTAGGIGLTTATATDAGHDITLIAPGAISAATLTAARNIGVTGGSANIATATATAGSLSVTGGTGAAIVGTGTAGAGITVMGASATATTLNAGGALLVRATAGDASLGTGTAGGTGTVSATGAAGIGSLTAAGAVNASAGTSATATALNSTGAATTVTGGSVNVGTAQAATALALSATAGNLTLTQGTAGTTGLAQSTGVTTVGSLTAVGNATVRGATGAAATTVTSTTGIVLVEASAGGASLGTGTAGTFGVVRGTTSASATNLTAGGGLLVDASAGDASLGTGVANGGTGTVSGTGTATATSLRASGTARLAAGTTATAGAIHSTGADVQVSGATTNVGTATAATSLTIGASGGPLTLTQGTSGGASIVNGSAAVTVGALAAGTGATIRGASVDATTVTATAGGLLVDAIAGNATVGTATAGGTGYIAATGAASVGTLTAGDTASLSAGGAASGGTIRSTGADAVVTGATATVGTAEAATFLNAVASNGDLTIDRGIAGTTALLGTTGGNGDVIVTTSLETGGTATIDSTGDARLALVRAATGDVIVDANGEVTGVDPATATNLTATTGAVIVDNGLVSRLGTIAGNGVTVSSGTVIAGDVNAGTGALSLTATNGPLSLTTGRAGTSATVQASGAATVATLTAGTDATIRGATAQVTTATATAGNLLVEATAGNATLGTGTAGGAGTVRGAGAASLTSLTAAGTATLTAGGAATAGTIGSSGANIAITGATATIGTAEAATALSARATGGDLTLTQGTAGTTAYVEASGLAAVQTLTAGTDATVRGAEAQVTAATATGGVLLVDAIAGNASLGTGVAGGNGYVAATGDAQVGTLTAGGDAFLLAGGAATGDTIRSIGANVIAEGATLTIDRTIAAAGQSLRATGGDLSLTEGIAGTSALVEATGLATVQTLTTGTDATIRGANVDATTATAATGNLLVDATAGNATLGAGVAGGTGTVQATGSAALTSLTAAGTATLTAGTTATAGTIRSTGADISVTGATTTLGTAEAATALDLVATGGDLTLGRGTALTTGRLRTTGGNGDVIVTTSLETGGAASVETVGDARLALVRAATGDVTVTALGGEVTGIGAAGANLTATAGAVNVTNGLLSRLEAVAGNGVTVASGTVVAGDIGAGTGALSLTATNGPLSLTTGAAGTTALVQASGAATVGTLTAGTDATIRGANVNATNLAAGGALLVDATAGNATLGTGVAGGTGTVRATGAVAIGSLTAAGTATLTAGTAGIATTIRSTGADVVATGASLDLGTADAGTTLAATASNGALTLGTGTAGGTGTLRTTGGGTAGDVSVTTSLTTGGAATIASVSDARLASVTAATGNVQVTAAAGEVTGIGAGNANLVAAAGAVNVEGGTLARLGTVGAAGTTGVTVTADTIEATNVNAGTGALSLVADTGGVTLGTGRSGTTSLIDARQTATISTGLTAGTSARINAANAEIGGPVAATTRIDVVNTGTGNPFVLGTATGTGFALSESEVNRLNAPELSLDARSNNVAIGALSFDGDTGGNRVDLLGLGRIDVTGTVAAPGGAATRVIRFGGSATASDKASVIRVAALANGGGGRLLMPNAALELRGVKIGVGQDGRFLESLGLTPGGAPLSGQQVGVDFIGNPQSTLYYSGNFGGAPYNPIGQTLVSANSLTVRTTDYALFQNTGTVGQTTGAVIDARTTNPKVPALTVSGPNPPDAGGFAIFGTFNGFEGSAAALLGATDISVIAVDGTRTRINGCIVGSGGGGCLSNSIVQPVVNVFDSSRSDVLKTSSDFEAPFDPVVGTNNESLFGDVGTFGLEDIPLTSESEPATEECGGPDKAPCAANEGQK